MASFDGILVTPSVMIAAAENISFPGLLLPANFDQVAPTVANVVPAEGSKLQPTSTIAFRVVDEFELKQAYVFAYYGSGQRDVVYDSGEFSPAYATSTLVKVDEKNWDFVIRKVGGWRSTPSIKVNGIDVGGNVTV